MVSVGFALTRVSRAHCLASLCYVSNPSISHISLRPTFLASPRALDRVQTFLESLIFDPNPCHLLSVNQTFSVIDKTGRGEIRVEDFTAAGKALGTWEDVRRHFDTDGNGVIDKREFRDGFKVRRFGDSTKELAPVLRNTFRRKQNL